uniref:mitogen-activated protein kinase kinase n=1 Tax=Acrobeloides nanus TaxID=290746 RepID=A0A914DNH8_9BILA
MVETNIPPSNLDDKLNELQFIYKYNPKDFEFVDIIESSRHIVKEFLYKPLKIKMAVKTIRIPINRYENNESDEKLTRLKREISSFRQLSHHPNIVNFYGLCFNDGEAMICMELMDMSLYDLYLVVHDKKEIFPEAILSYIAIQVLEALGFYSLASTFVGTIAYWPPERFETLKDQQNTEADFHYDVRSDIWSLGITLAETALGSLPFVDEHNQPISRENNGNENIVTIQHCIMHTDTDKLIKRCFGETYSENFVNFVKMCLEKLENRPKYNELVKTEFYKKFIGKITHEDRKNF